ncbi:NAD-dependent epimerase/dehydratase family protein [Saccharothrix sp. ALI-22-I]|uniref:NAD-dependent epimerase/dehydratase family protein n=1 Tax=Saccharothrix sp. ALI-22-I TaxID=1933778 RepID=UPI00117AFCB3|nr:NAD-dependent epimerase/dehydratase family protein [Saccharothrix sp. ALI-22-I]
MTGGTGFVGSRSIAAFSAAGHRVRGLARNTSAVDVVLRPPGVDLDAGRRHRSAAGHHVAPFGYLRTLRAVTGRRLPAVLLSATAMPPVGALALPAQRVWPWHIPAEYGATCTCVCDTRVAEHTGRLGPLPRPMAETMSDTMRRLHRAGRLTRRQAGSLGDAHLLGDSDD